ncbi:hypothetical protein J1N35_000240 [Gossypium stocksii]|uniref:Uncharacterized protein n=1 Tax=Gossypium stocksii TaxID=47602 RepID=A0A9D3WFC6_9ROSI|nr:hypothetical protein J1N35_000240 [Gossypium stocksii]
MSYSVSLSSPIHFHTNSRFFFTFPPKLPNKLKTTATTTTVSAIPPLSTATSVTDLSVLDSTTVALIGGGSVAALAAVLSFTDSEHRRHLQVEEVGGGDKEVISVRVVVCYSLLFCCLRSWFVLPLQDYGSGG